MHIFLFVIFKLRLFLSIKFINKNKIGTMPRNLTSNSIMPSATIKQSSRISMVFDENANYNINNSSYIEKDINASYDNKAFNANDDKF